jgi:Mg-chelatase subunit ChlD
MTAAVSHLRARKSALLLAQALEQIDRIDQSAQGENILKGASELCRLNWALILPFFEASKKLHQHGDLIAPWSRLACELARHDIDVAVTFIEQTPVVMEHRGAASLSRWGELALKALVAAGKEAKMWPAAKAYLIEAAACQCGYPLSRWDFFLEQTLRIAAVSSAAAQAFVQMGNRMCLLLTDAETVNWVTEGLDACRSEQELVNFFSGTSLKALEARDGLASGIALKDKIQILALICEAALGRSVKMQSNIALIGLKGFSGGAATDGRTIFLPDTVPSFGLLKLMALHQAMLLDHSRYLENGGKIIFDPTPIHVSADKRLIGLLPGLLTEMTAAVDSDLPTRYPHRLDKKIRLPLPWWGDILPELINQTNATIASIKKQAADEYEEVPPEVIETLLAAMMAQGERDGDALWEMFRQMLDNMVFDSPDAEELQENVRTFFYKEWDHNFSDYKLDWCLVRQRPANGDPNDFVDELSTRLHGIITLLRRQFMKLKPERFRKYRAQPSGDALDIDALVQAHVDRRTGSGLSENVYIRRDKRIRDVAVLFLLDLSGSTEEMVNNRRVIDVQKEAMALMAEALDALGDPYAVFGFSSEGRFRVDMFTVKDFNEAYDEKVRYRLGNLEPLGLTRMGAVIRHGVYKLEGVSAAVKLLVLMTDGRPYDLEYGTLDYAVADTGKAIREARRARIHPFIITSDQKGAEYLRRISSETQSIVLPQIESLPALLPALYKRLTL